MKKISITLLTVTLLLLTTALIIDFRGDGGFSKSSCSSIFVTCEASCTETHVYSTSGCGQNFYFPDCACNGLTKDEKRNISFNSKQENNLDSFTQYISKIHTENSSELVSTLKKIKRSIEMNNAIDYSNEIEHFKKIAESLNETESSRIKNWIQGNTPHNKTYTPCGL